MDTSPLTAPEALILRNPNQPQGREALKLALTELLARRILTMRHEEKKGFLGSVQSIDLLQRTPEASQQLPTGSPLQAVLGLLSGAGMEMNQVVEQAQKTFGSDFSGFQQNHILPALVKRGLLETCTEKVLWVIPVTRYCHTPTGELTRQRLETQITQAHSLPDLLDNDPAQAAALVFSLGSAALLVGEIRAHSARLSQALRDHSSGADGMPLFYYSASDGSGQPDKPDPTNFDGGLFDSNFDLDAFDNNMDTFDNSFDSSADAGGGDSGGDGGGGGED